MTKSLKHLNILFLEDNETFAEHTINFLKLYYYLYQHGLPVIQELPLVLPVSSTSSVMIEINVVKKVKRNV